ncbi:protein OBERON 3 [Humulus lupulus]|uniref:protein OBERON 3 n=1 Tax=Humulus lupulus TaxID=3486 RepID=UPI002B40F8E8|nr:protein OBERON 3 [Humulus lupulus]
MFGGDKDLTNSMNTMDESSVSKLTRFSSERNKNNPDKKMGFLDKGMGFLRESEMGSDGFQSRASKFGNSGSQELTLSYLCDFNSHSNANNNSSSKQAFLEKDFTGKNLLNSFDKGGSSNYKGKEVVVSENSIQGDKWVERDFLNLNENRLNSSKREMEVEEEEDDNGVERENRDKRPKLETLNLSLALPEVSLSLTASNALQNGGENHPTRSRPTRSFQSLAPSSNTQTTYSNDYTNASLSYSHSHPFSHNPSCSLTRNSTENYEYSVGKDDQIWNCGEGTNGSVHSRFKPVGDGVALSNHGGSGLFALMQGNNRKDSCNNNNSSLHKTTSSDNNHSFFPSELPARLRMDTQSGDSRGKASESLRGLEGVDGGRPRKVSKPERILREIVSESVPAMAQTIQELSDETLLSTKEYLRNLISMADKKDELEYLQNRLKRRSDLTKETLTKCQKDQLEILVAVKFGLGSFLSVKNRLPPVELVETFLSVRCKNVNCKSLLPVDDCDCKICSENKGFCSSCMCPVCFKFDYASNTCSWVGCDVCSHWCHASCGIQRNLIRPGPSLKGPSGTTEMQFHCICCDHASEMFGFVKDVFLCCAKDWGLENLVKELDCVRKIFRGSDDFKGKELHNKADEIISKLANKFMSPTDACSFIIQFFNNTDSMSEFSSSVITSKELSSKTQSSVRKETTAIPQSTSLAAKYAPYNMSSSLQRDVISNDLRLSDHKSSIISSDDDFRFGSISKPDGFDSLESIVRVKEAEARMFQSKADEARRDAEEYHRMIRATTEKLEGEHAEKLSKLCLQETEDRRRKKLDELKILENSHCDYYNMKIRMQAEIAGLLERMEATKQQWV